MATLPTVQSYTETFHMPFVTPGVAVQSPKELGYEVYLRPQYSRALFDIIRHYRWESVHYVFDSEEGKSAKILFFGVMNLNSSEKNNITIASNGEILLSKLIKLWNF